MPGRFVAVLLCASLFACTESVDERLAELNARVTVDCGVAEDCGAVVEAEAVVACIRDNFAAGIPAKAVITLDIDRSAYVYALDGAYVSVEGYSYDGDGYFAEYRCNDVEIVRTSVSCVMAGTIECEKIREWGSQQ